WVVHVAPFTPSQCFNVARAAHPLADRGNLLAGRDRRAVGDRLDQRDQFDPAPRLFVARALDSELAGGAAVAPRTGGQADFAWADLRADSLAVARRSHRSRSTTTVGLGTDRRRIGAFGALVCGEPGAGPIGAAARRFEFRLPRDA